MGLNVTIPGDEISGGTAGTPFDISGASRHTDLRYRRPVDFAGIGNPDPHRDTRADHRGRPT